MAAPAHRTLLAEFAINGLNEADRMELTAYSKANAYWRLSAPAEVIRGYSSIQ